MSGSIPVSNSTSPPEAASGRLPPEGGAPPAAGQSPLRGGRWKDSQRPVHLSPGRRAWQRFRRNRLGYFSLVIFCVMVGLSLFAEGLSNDRPLVVRYQGQTYFPVVRDYSEQTFGGDFPTPADYLDP